MIRDIAKDAGTRRYTAIVRQCRPPTMTQVGKPGQGANRGTTKLFYLLLLFLVDLHRDSLITDRRFGVIVDKKRLAPRRNSVGNTRR